jgi:hypothetical protein
LIPKLIAWYNLISGYAFVKYCEVKSVYMIGGKRIVKVSRKYARISIVLTTVGSIIMIFSSYIENLTYLYISVGFIAIAFIIKFFVLKCPYCGWGGAIPQLSKIGTIHCPKCGKAMEYDK